MESKIHFLQARHGDAFVLECHQDDNLVTIVVDGGPFKGSTEIVKYFKSLSNIDLMVLTHFDDDHIGGILRYVKENKDSDAFQIKRMWLNNCANHSLNANTFHSIPEAIELADCLFEIAKKKELLWTEIITESYETDIEFVHIEVVSPPSFVLDLVLDKLEENNKQHSKRADQKRASMNKTLCELAENEVNSPILSKPDELFNAASIAFILSVNDSSVLFLGDSHPKYVEEYLRNQKHINETNKLKVKYVKVSHHGSLNNSSKSLYSIIDCSHYIISTNGKNGFYHPDREAIAKIVKYGSRDGNGYIHLYFNYDKKHYEGDNSFLTSDEVDYYKIDLHYQTKELPL